jgi:uncharacterized membrane protein
VDRSESIPSERSRDFKRFLTFVDAVVAIAITLLVLPLIELLGDREDDDLAALLGDHLTDFAAFALSFVVIARLWLVHHKLVEWVGRYDALFTWLSLFWAFTIVFLPFATQVIAEFGTDRLSVALYIGTITVSSVASTLLFVLVRGRPALRRPGVEAADVPLVPALVASGLLVLALVLGVAFRPVNFYALLLLLLAGPVEALVGRLTRRG